MRPKKQSEILDEHGKAVAKLWGKCNEQGNYCAPKTEAKAFDDAQTLKRHGAPIDAADLFCWRLRLDAGDPDNNVYSGIELAARTLDIRQIS